MSKGRKQNLALVLSGGGARGAYQAGVLYGLHETGLISDGPCPFPIMVGTSAGSIHVTALAAYADRYEKAVRELLTVWSRIHPKDVFRTDFLSVSHLTFQWVRDLILGGIVGGVVPKALLDTSPLPLLLNAIPYHRIKANIEKGYVKALAVPATEYFSNESVIFLQGEEGVPTWQKTRARVELTEIRRQHILASSAIPMLFPTVALNGRHFGDGCLRNTTPLGPAIRLGATKILAVGVHEPAGLAESRAPMVADVASTILDAIMMDAMEKDVAHCQRISESCSDRDDGAFRPVDVMWLAPPEPIAPIARSLMDRIPFLIRYLLHGLGGDRASAELASYLLFHPDYTNRLMDLGRWHVHNEREKIAEFLEL